MVLELATLIVGAGTAIASPFLPGLAKRIACVAAKWSIRDQNIHEMLRKMEKTVSDIQKKLADGENNFYMSNTFQIRIEEVNNALFDVEDLLARAEAGFENLGIKIDELQKTLDELESKLEVFNIISHTTQSSNSSHPQNRKRQTSSMVDESAVFGRINDQEQIIRLMLPTETQEGVCVISIVGMVGIGKTTLAQLVFNDPEVKKVFEMHRMWWVSVSSEDDAFQITKAMCESTTKTIPDPTIAQISSLDSLKHKLKEIVGDKDKFLLVLDGICDEDSNNWRDLILPFQSAATGSIILVTTQSLIVSSIVTDSCYAYCLGGLSDEQCWKIIKHRLRKTKSESDKDFEKSGLEIAKNCKGIPLVAVSIGDVFSLKREQNWNEIFKCRHWDLAEKYKNKIYPVLKFGYHKLPAPLKRCFAYSSLFPQSRLQRDDLIQLWAAEGFIQATQTSEEDINQAKIIEDIGRGYFDELCLQSFFQVSSNKSGEYEMHGFIYDFAGLVSTNLCCAYEGNLSNVSHIATNVRHSSLACEKMNSSMWEEFYRCTKLRTFILLSEHTTIPDGVPDKFFELICLRVLNLSGSTILDLSEKIKMLKLLRLLNLSGTKIRKLPDNIGDVCGLEILDMKKCENLNDLPSSIIKLTKLRHIEDDKTLIGQLVHVGKLTSLETLPEFVVEDKSGRKIGELKGLSWLHGSICIKKLENVASGKEAKAAELNTKQYLEELKLHWDPKERRAVDEEVLEGLEPHRMLKKLQVKGYSGLKFPEWMGKTSFGELVRVHLEDCASCTLLPSLGKLPLLKHVVIVNLGNLEHVNDQLSDGFSSLITLTFKNMGRLESWTTKKAMAHLTELTIEACPKFVTLPSSDILPSLKQLEIDGCPELKSFPMDTLPQSLQSLIIFRSDFLKTNYCTEGKNYWVNMSFIPEIETDDGKLKNPKFEDRYVKVQDVDALSRDRPNKLDRSKRVRN